MVLLHKEFGIVKSFICRNLLRKAFREIIGIILDICCNEYQYTTYHRRMFVCTFRLQVGKM